MYVDRDGFGDRIVCDNDYYCKNAKYKEEARACLQSFQRGYEVHSIDFITHLVFL